jgi:monoamine oxidase
MSVVSREVLVIGARIAGLTAARDLAIDGYDVAILEARERIGGRIWTSHEFGLPAGLGASWKPRGASCCQPSAERRVANRS